jgi:hypothetical protein
MGKLGMGRSDSRRPGRATIHRFSPALDRGQGRLDNGWVNIL